MTTYRERLTAPISWWLAALGFAVVWGWIMLIATNWPIAIVVAVVVAAADLYLVWRYGSTLVSVTPEGLHVGAAHLEAAHVGEVTPLDRAAYRTRLGTGADARAYLVTRPYLDHGVTVGVADPSDPTPYWLISSRHPEALAAALGSPTQAPQKPAHDPIGDPSRGEEA
ncbi:DUF3093 domain-containing protein [Aeromicrobium chenweiae]|uniref:DUF3093 domain-containing protein n=1 Tax=Aeromicrobium chenweiae TaxID=2079793 RepID=A0A2S0WL52_9ACTN|nr:DUF3093 domain-containing protein [Aeromicrobium chenweiae]AWB92076.1 DUF3093 domain-containing protein [Aeromicrobium chenweiae]TGN32925.1 DUF3093 domain-containing protein [Aeromicrobium chenweiae]